MEIESDMLSIVSDFRVRISKLESDLCACVNPTRLDTQTLLATLQDLYDNVKASKGENNRNWEVLDFRDNEIRGICWSGESQQEKLTITTKVFPAPKTGETREMFIVTFYSHNNDVRESAATETPEEMIEFLDETYAQ